jgi:secreted trypsin-like serine protease
LEPDEDAQDQDGEDRTSDTHEQNGQQPHHEDEEGEETAARAGQCSSKIVGGCASRPGSWPSFVQLGSAGYSGCGGTVIAKNWVLTAAHCVAEVEPGPNGCVRKVKTANSLEVYEGSNRPVGTAGVKPKRTLRVAEVIPHEGYTGDCGASPMQNDIALLRLRDTAKATPGVLASDRSLDTLAKPGKLTTVVGVGITEHGTGNRPQAMMQVDIPLVSEATCRQGASSQYNANSINYSNQLCAGYPKAERTPAKGTAAARSSRAIVSASRCK